MAHRLWLMVAAAALLTTSPAHATPLGTLIDTSATITVGDKVFSNFSLHDVSDLNSTPADPRNLQIDGITNLLGEHGLRVSGFFVSLPNSSSSAALIFSLEYDVTVTDPSFRLHDIHHVFSTTSNRGAGLSLITQAGFPPNVNGSMQSVVGFGGTGQLLVDNVNETRNLTNLVSTQHMLNNFEAHAQTIFVSEAGPAILGAITTSPFDLTFSQTRVVPEPATWLLLSSGLLSLLGFRKIVRAR